MLVNVGANIVVPVNAMQLIDDTDFKSIESSVAYDAAGLVLVWNFLTPAGVQTQTQVVPTTGGAHDWTNLGNGMYSIAIPAEDGTINNVTVGFGWFTGVATGVLPWRGPTIGVVAVKIAGALTSAIFQGDVRQLLGINWLPPGTPGTPDVNAKLIGGTAQSTGDLSASLTAMRGTTSTIDNLFQRVNTAQNGGGPNKITLDSGASSVDDFYGPVIVLIIGGTGAGQARFSPGGTGSYSGSNKQLSIEPAWTTNTNSTSVFALIPVPGVAQSQVFSGITSLAQWLGLMAGKQVGNANARTEVRATGAGSGTYDETTDSLEAQVQAVHLNRIADHVLRRQQALVEQSADGDAIDDAASLFGAIQQLRNADTTTTAGKLTIKKAVDPEEVLEELDLDTAADLEDVQGVSP